MSERVKPISRVYLVAILSTCGVTVSSSAQDCRVCAYKNVQNVRPGLSAGSPALWPAALGPAYRVTTTNDDEKPSFWVEAGYVVAMETVFTGMSFLASRDDGRVRAVTGGFDAFMGVAGLGNAVVKKPRVQRVGHFLIATGFIAKAAYNFGLSRNHSRRQRFLTNYVGFNVLVFTGYYLDEVGN